MYIHTYTHYTLYVHIYIYIYTHKRMHIHCHMTLIMPHISSDVGACAARGLARSPRRHSAEGGDAY